MDSLTTVGKLHCAAPIAGFAGLQQDFCSVVLPSGILRLHALPSHRHGSDGRCCDLVGLVLLRLNISM
jgi:hypothetical protein